eukprot:592577-Pyramimonas_sp.AAC.1
MPSPHPPACRWAQCGRVPGSPHYPSKPPFSLMRLLSGLRSLSAQNSWGVARALWAPPGVVV